METRKVLIAEDFVFDSYYDSSSEVFWGVFDSVEAILAKLEAEGIQYKTEHSGDRTFWKWEEEATNEYGDSYILTHVISYKECEVQGVNYYGV